MTERYLKIEKGLVVNISNGESCGYIPATGELKNAGIGDVIQNGKIIPPVDKRTWVDKRVEAYGPVSEQLGMMYDDKVNGTSNWVKHVQNVKKKYPKPQEKK